MSVFRSRVAFLGKVIPVYSADIVGTHISGRRVLAHEIAVSITRFGVLQRMLIVVRGARLGFVSAGSLLPRVVWLGGGRIPDHRVGRCRLGVDGRVVADPRRTAIVPVAAVTLRRPDTLTAVRVLG